MTTDPNKTSLPCDRMGCEDQSSPTLDRRALLIGSGVAAAGMIGLPLVRRILREKGSAFLASGQRYDAGLEQTIRDGLLASGVDPARMKGLRVLLKPNLVEPSATAPHRTTHPAVVVATAEVFRRWGAQVTVGEGPGHVRDTEEVLWVSGMEDALAAADLQYVDLNHDEVRRAPNKGRFSKLRDFHFPRAVLEADMIVSLPKLKTHHWVGFTASMKNLYGTLPGIMYGWPKNVLHYAGIPQTVVDINASLPKKIAVIDGIMCMEGDGPIMGTPKPLGMIAVGTNLPALDATCARVMGIEPSRISYLQLAADRLGPIDERLIEQRGEDWRRLVSPFGVLDVPHLRDIRASEETPLIAPG